MAQSFKPAWSILTIASLKLYGKYWKEGDYKSGRPAIFFTAANGIPRLRAYINFNGEKHDTLSAPIDIYECWTFLDKFKEIAAKPEADKLTLKVKTDFDGKVRLPTPATVAMLTVGKDEAGICYITVQFKGERLILVQFLMDPKMEYITSTGENLSAAEYSKSKAIGWCNTIQHILPTEIITHTTEPPATNNGYGGGSGSSTPSSNSTWDDDVVF
jgi:hypothetical protein